LQGEASEHDLARCIRIIEKEYGNQGLKAAFEMAGTGVQGGLIIGNQFIGVERVFGDVPLPDMARAD
jgi:hypothetical protein